MSAYPFFSIGQQINIHSSDIHFIRRKGSGIKNMPYAFGSLCINI